MKIKTTKTATAAPMARRKTQSTSQLIPDEPLTLTLRLSGLARQGYLSMCKNDEEAPGVWLKKSVASSIAAFFEFHCSGERLNEFTTMLESEAKL